MPETNGVNALRYETVNKHMDDTDKMLERVTAAVETLATLVARGDERLAAHITADDIVREVVGKHTSDITSMTQLVAPLVDMRKWLIAAALALVGTFSASAFNAVSNWISNKEAANALPVAAKRVEDVLVTPQFERKEKVESIKRTDEKPK